MESWFIIDAKVCYKAFIYIYSVCSHLFYVTATKSQPTRFQFCFHVYICFCFFPFNSKSRGAIILVLFMQKYSCLSKLIVTLCHPLMLLFRRGKASELFEHIYMHAERQRMNEFIFRTLLSLKPKGTGRVCGNLNLAFLQKKTSNPSLKIFLY